MLFSLILYYHSHTNTQLMAVSRKPEQMIAEIKQSHKENMGKTLSIEYVCSIEEYISITADLFKYPSISISYNSTLETYDKVYIVIGY